MKKSIQKPFIVATLITSILGTNIDFINIAIYYICVIAAYFVAYKSKKQNATEFELIYYCSLHSY